MPSDRRQDSTRIGRMVQMNADKKFIKIPAGDSSSSFAHLLLTICLDQQIEKVFPLRKVEILALSEARQLFDEYGIKIMVPDKTLLQLPINQQYSNRFPALSDVKCLYLAWG